MGGNVERHIGDDDRDGAANQPASTSPANPPEGPMTPDQYRREGAEAMRMSCAHAVNATASPIVGTPYSAGGRAFSDAIRALDVDDVLARLPPAPDPEARLVEAVKHLQDIINCGNCSGSRQSARLALRALKGDA